MSSNASSLLPAPDSDLVADNLEQQLFTSPDAADEATRVINDIVRSYSENRDRQSPREWLRATFEQRAQWQSPEELDAAVNDVVNTIEQNNQAKAELKLHLDKGNSQASWLARKIEQAAAASGSANVGRYAGNIEQAISTANQNSIAAITRLDGQINRGSNLDGFIAEHHHANTFNIDAAAKGSDLQAKVLVPDGVPYGKDSPDIQISRNGEVVAEYQSKYGADAKATNSAFEQGDYGEQKKLVPEGQGNAVDGGNEVLSEGGVESKPLSKEEAKAMQEKAQLEQEATQYDWNDANRSTIARQIGKQALLNASIAAGMQGARILGRRCWNRLQGRDNPPANEDMREFFESAVDSAAQAGIQTAVAGALVVAAKNGLLGAAMKNTPAGRLANIAYIGLDNAKIMYRYANGELEGNEALDEMGQATTIAVISLAAAGEGALLGASVGAVGGPLGIAVGGFIGGMAGGIAGGVVGEAVYKGGRTLIKCAGEVANTIVSSAGRALSSAVSAFTSLFA